mgnify:CR=1 FL=1
MCGIVGIVASDEVRQDLYDALTILQHRGQDAAGIVTSDGNQCFLRKSNGLVSDVFQEHHMQRLHGTVGLGHCRYPTAGSSSSAEAQPLYVNSPYGLALAHNGNLTNSAELRSELTANQLRHLNTSSDSEVLLNIFANELGSRQAVEPSPDDIFKAVGAVHEQCKGAYATVAMIIGSGIVGFRDRYGIRPLVYGRRQTDIGFDYMIASESVALDILGFELVADVSPGEAIFISNDGQVYTQQCAQEVELVPCIFEHVYLARPDSILDGMSVYKSRLKMGEYLAEQILKHYSGRDHDIDVVIPIPDTGRTAALPLAHELNTKYREGFVKNRYIGRTFIMPGQSQRRKSVRQKLNAIELEFKEKNVLLVDDSIVRGTTCKQIIQMAREAGAKKVYFASAAPAIRYPNVYGIDMPAATELIAAGKTDEEVESQIGADWLIYQDLEDLIAAAAEGNPKIQRFECSVFNGEYITSDVDEMYLKRLELVRNDAAKSARNNRKKVAKQQNLVADLQSDG